MATTQLEFVSLPNGDFALRECKGGNVLVRIQFSPTFKKDLNEDSTLIKQMAKSMLQAGVDVINQQLTDENKRISSKEILLH